ncbi:hypothetical protein KY285_010560 [Solanum tuberosum]|nr:hypothetical protein KY285_010560 [Solanum tuberosum]
MGVSIGGRDGERMGLGFGISKDGGDGEGVNGSSDVKAIKGDGGRVGDGSLGRELRDVYVEWFSSPYECTLGDVGADESAVEADELSSSEYATKRWISRVKLPGWRDIKDKDIMEWSAYLMSYEPGSDRVSGPSPKL